MRHPLTQSIALTLVLAVLSVPSYARKSTERPQPRIYSPPSQTVDLPPELQSYVYLPQPTPAIADTFQLGWWSFDPGGNPNPQGWVAVDQQAQIGDFFHVQDATILDGGDFGRLNVLEGNQTMWCGTYVGYSAETCGYATLPGYGNSWDQRLQSKVFSGCDSVRVCFLAAWDSEPGYDVTQVEWRTTNPPGPWAVVATATTGYYSGWDQGLDCFGVRDPNSAPQIRFRFTSDGAWSDEDGQWPSDGAFFIDSLTVEWYNEVPPTSGNWVLSATYYEDFEDETPGAHVTNDGCWTSVPRAGFQTLGALYSGLTVLQEDPCVFNATALWGFFDDPMITNYACGGFPSQGAIPPGPDAEGLYMMNAVVSPMIPITGTGDKFLVSFDVYRDMPLDGLIFWDMDMRHWVAGCPSGWFRGYDFVNYGGGKDWLTTVENVGTNVDPSASHLQVRLEALDMCAIWCGVFGTGSCHSHGPLYDNVRVVRVNDIGPQVSVRHIDLFQDNFSEDGTITGPARADMAADIAPNASPTILPGDSICATAAPLGTDPNTGVGPAAYCYVAILPRNQAGKTPIDIEAPEMRFGVGKRFPLVGTTSHNGLTWACFRMDSTYTNTGGVVSDRWCFDLNDNVFTPGDTILYVLGFDDGVGNARYFTRWVFPHGSLSAFVGSGPDFVTNSRNQALSSPMEFQVLPGGGNLRGGDILVVDDADDRAGPPQLFMDWAFRDMGIHYSVDRYDVLSPSSSAGNGLASRVKNISSQIIGRYRTIIWYSGDLSAGLIGDGTGSPEKSDDYGLLFDFLDNSPDDPGLYISGDDVAEEWVTLAGAGAVNLRSIYMNFNLVSGDHVGVGEPVSPLMTATAPCFIELGIPNVLMAYGGCPGINDFDVLATTGSSATAFPYPNGSGDAVISQTTPNSAGSTANVMLSGFGYHYIRDFTLGYPMLRVSHIRNVLRCFGHIHPVPVAIPELTGNDFLLNPAPNPFNPETTIRYGIRRQGHVSLKVYNVAGQLVRTLVNEVKAPRAEGFEIAWDGRDDRGVRTASGVYFYRLAAGGFVQTKKMVLLK